RCRSAARQSAPRTDPDWYLPTVVRVESRAPALPRALPLKLPKTAAPGQAVGSERMLPQHYWPILVRLIPIPPLGQRFADRVRPAIPSGSSIRLPTKCWDRVTVRA